MSRVWSGSGARVCALLASALLACSGKGSNDLFAPASSTGTCTGADCNPADAATHGQGSGGAGSSSTTTAGGTSSSTTGIGTSGGGAGGGATTGGGAGATGGNGVGGAAGTGTGGSQDDSGINPVEDAQTIDAVVDSGGLGDAVVVRDACVPTGQEVCDGIDNNCNGGVDENNACRTGCVGATYAGIGYMLCYGQTQRREWRAAQTDCTNHNMHLMRVDSAEQNAFIRSTSLSVGYSDTIWIGGSDSAREGTWVWTDGVQFWQGGVLGHVVDGHFAAWDMDQPNSADGPEDCAAVWTGIETWHDLSCLGIHAYICQGLAPTR
jgi:hypothetical protein